MPVYTRRLINYDFRPSAALRAEEINSKNILAKHILLYLDQKIHEFFPTYTPEN